MKKLILLFASVATFTLSNAQVEELLSRSVQVGVVTVDTTTWHNLVVWQRVDLGWLLAQSGGMLDLLEIDNYNIFRWDSASAQYIKIGELPYAEMPVFEDPTSEPKIRSYKYKITANFRYSFTMDPMEYPFESYIDSCRYHKSLWLRKTMNNDTMQVEVEPYEVEGFNMNTFLDTLMVYIYRSTEIATLFDSLYDSIAYYPGDTLFQYSDPDLNALGTQYYYIGTVKLMYLVDPLLFTTFKASSGPYSQSISNLEDTRLKGTTEPEIIQSNIVADFNVYPNPTEDQVFIDYELADPARVQVNIYTNEGKKVAKLGPQRQPAGKHSYQVFHDAGKHGGNMLFITLVVNGKKEVKKVLKIK
jgi:hypothetical protein